MNIKSLLLGSAAALVAVSGARAADAVVVAEPEPVEYVRVCDVYGAGFFYIPGTETCLQISGYARYEVSVSSAYDGWEKSATARVNFDARSETEWGTLQAYIRFEGANGGLDVGVDAPVGVDQAFIRFGNNVKVTMGYTESYWVDSKDPLGAYGTHSPNGLPYGYQQRNLVAFNFAGGNGFYGSLSLEDDDSNDFVPDVVVKAGMAQSWGSVYGALSYDETDNSMAVRVGGTANVPVGMGGSLRLYGFYSQSATNAYWGTSRWAVTASYAQTLSSTLSAAIGAQYQNDFSAGGVFTANDKWWLQGSVTWTPVSQFEIRAEAAYDTFTEAYSGRLRFTRYF